MSGIVNTTGSISGVVGTVSGNTTPTLDYQTGVETVTMTCGSGTITMNSVYNKIGWTKIGQFVAYGGSITILSVSSPSGTLNINGLPFSCASAGATGYEFSPSGGPYGIYKVGGLSPGINMCVAYHTPGTTDIYLRDFNGTTVVDTMAAQMVAGVQFAISGNYITAS